MKNTLLGLCVSIFMANSLQAIPLAEFLNSSPVGQQVSEWKASPLVPEDLVGKTFQIPTNPDKIWQVRFFTFEDREKSLQDHNRFVDLVKMYGLEALESKKDAMPYNDGTFESFTFKDANAYLQAKGEKPLPREVYFIISFRDVSDVKKN